MDTSQNTLKTSIIPTRSFIAKSLFFFFYLIVTSVLIDIFSIVMSFSSLIWTGFAVDQFLFVFVPVLLFVLICFFVFRLTSSFIFFLIQFFYISYVFSYVYQLSSTNPHGIQIVLLSALMMGFIAGTITFVWKSIYRHERYLSQIVMLFLSILATIIYIIPSMFVMDVYVFIGGYIRMFFNINIFFLDYGGFAVFFLAFTTCLNYWGFTLLSTVPNLYKKVSKNTLR